MDITFKSRDENVNAEYQRERERQAGKATAGAECRLL
jgi:hypothetical protein